jgi:ferritin-like metal-binding protein YciE
MEQRWRSPTSSNVAEVPMANRQQGDVMAWLRDAHAMEAGTIDNLERLIGLSDEYPQLKSQLAHHLEVSKRQRDEIERALERLGTDRSKLKDWAMRLAGQMEPLVSWFTRDSMPKNCLAAHAYEALEIASYRSLLGAAEELGMAELRGMCERFIREEQEMADFLFEHLPEITRQYLRSRAS